MKMNKLYGKGTNLHLCFRGSHYASPNHTVFTPKCRIPVIQGEEPGTVLVAGCETWTLMGSYTKSSTGGAKPKNASKKRTAKRLVDETVQASRPTKDTSGVPARIKAVAPCEDAEGLMMVMWENWLRMKDVPGLNLGNLFGGLNYLDPAVTRSVRGLGLELTKEFL